MKKLLIGAASAVALTLALSVPASAENYNSKVCKAFGDLGLSHGECTSTLDVYFGGDRGNDFAVDYCKYLANYYPDDFDLYFKSRGACVSALRKL